MSKIKNTKLFGRMSKNIYIQSYKAPFPETDFEWNLGFNFMLTVTARQKKIAYNRYTVHKVMKVMKF